MTPLEELRAGAPGDQFVHLLYRTVAVVARARNFPPPPDHPTWSRDAVIETAHDLLVSPNADRRLTELAAMAADDESLERLLGATVTNHLRENGRRTTVGKLIRRLRSLLDDDPRFITVPDGVPGAGNVALREAPNTAPFAGPPRDLLAAAHRIRYISVTRWRPTARREGPVADAESLLSICEVVLTAADASLRLPDLAEIVADRLGINPTKVPMTMSVDDLDRYDHDSVDADHPIRPASDSSETRHAEEAADVLDQLSDREMLVMAWLHEPVRTIADRTGLATSTAGAVKQRLTEKLRVMLLGEPADRADAIAVSTRDAARRALGLDPV